MPRYKGLLPPDEETSGNQVIHLFEYCGDDNGKQDNRKTYRKEIIALDSCIFINRRSLARRARRKTEEQERQLEEEGGAEEEEVEDDREVDEGSRGGPVLQEGQEFDAYVIKCPNGPYDYALKMWDIGRIAPRDSQYPKEDEEMEGLVIDRNGDYVTIACGSNIAYATKKSFLHAGVDPDDLSLPFGKLKVSLTKAETRPQEVSVAAWVARPTQVAVPAYDVC